MYTKGRRKGTIRFSIKLPSQAGNVQVAGEFNDWTPTRLRKGKEGVYVTHVRVEHPGIYEYKYVVDGQWLTDPENKETVSNVFGKNSVAEVQ